MLEKLLIQLSYECGLQVFIYISKTHILGCVALSNDKGTFLIDLSLSVWWILTKSNSIHLFFWQYSSYIYAQLWSSLHSLALVSQLTGLGVDPSSSTEWAPVPRMSEDKKTKNISVICHSSLSTVAII